MIINNRISEIRRSQGLTIKEFALKMNVSERAIENWETNVSNLSVNSLITISKKTGYPTDYILGITPKTSIDISWMDKEAKAHLAAFLNDIKNSHKH